MTSGGGPVGGGLHGDQNDDGDDGDDGDDDDGGVDLAADGVDDFDGDVRHAYCFSCCW